MLCLPFNTVCIREEKNVQSGSKVTLIPAGDFLSKNLSNNHPSFHFLYRITQAISGSIRNQ